MGWWPFSDNTRADAIRSGTAVPTRTERQLCWEARDAYFACLDANSIVDAHKDASAAGRACPQQTRDFERDCAVAWVKYFKQWRVADIQKQRRLEELRKQGAEEVPLGAFSPAMAADTAAVAPSKKPAVSKDRLQDMLDQKRER